MSSKEYFEIKKYSRESGTWFSDKYSLFRATLGLTLFGNKGRIDPRSKRALTLVKGNIEMQSVIWLQASEATNEL